MCDFEVHTWAFQRLQRRYSRGTMVLEEADPLTFTGLHTVWRNGFLCISPDLKDPWSGASYLELDNSPLKHWLSWGPPHVREAVVRGILARCFYFSNTVDSREDAFWEAGVLLTHVAGFPLYVFARVARLWAAKWIPRGCVSPCDTSILEIERTILRLSSDLP